MNKRFLEYTRAVLTAVAVFLVLTTCKNTILDMIAEDVKPKLPVLKLVADGTDPVDQYGTKDFGQVVADGDGGEVSAPFVFTITNDGNSALVLGESGIDMQGDVTDFELQDDTTSPLPPGETAQFTVTFDPVSLGNKEITVSIPNNTSTDPYTFTLTGEGIFEGTVAAPNFNYASETYNNDFQVTMTCSTSGATIYYTTNGDEPSESSTQYVNPVPISQSLTLKAKAYKAGMNASSEQSATYTMAVLTPTFSPSGGSYTSTQNITISCGTSGATVRYTTDDSTPTTTYGTIGTSVAVNQSLTLKAIAYKPNYATSSVRSSSYNLVVPTPVISPNGGSFSSVQSVALACSESGALIRYTVDGSTPTATHGQLYTGSPFVLEGSTTLRAIAYKTGWSNSSIASAPFHIIQTLSTDHYVFSSVIAEGSNYYVSYRERNANLVKLVKSSDGGKTWSSHITVDSNPNSGYFIDMAKNGAEIYLTYIDSYYKLWFAISDDYGNAGTWTTMVVDQEEPPDTYVFGDTSIAIWSPLIYVVFPGDTTSDLENMNLRFVKTSDDGDSWYNSFGLRVVDTGGSPGRVGGCNSMTMMGNAIYVVYADHLNEDLKFASSASQGNSWSIDTIDSSGSVGGGCAIDYDGSSTVYVSYYDETNGNLKYAKRGSSTSWEWVTGIVDSSVDDVGQNTAIAAEGSNVYICYRDGTNEAVKFAYSANGGDSWSVSTIDSNGDVGDYPEIAVSGSNVSVTYGVWDDWHLRFAKSLDGGITW